MKFLLPLFLVLYANSPIQAQDCKGYYYLSNSEVQMTTYDKKEKESGKLTYKISGLNTAGGSTTADFTSEMVDEKGKTISKGAGKYRCTGGTLFVDAKAAMPGDQMAAYKDMEVKAEEVYIEYPASLSDGQSLKDVNYKMEVFSKGSLFSTVSFEQTGRKVTGKESLTTAAGTFECWKISYDARIKASMAPMNIGIPINMQITEWFAPGFGIVKTVVANKNGKLMGTTLISAVKK